MKKMDKKKELRKAVYNKCKGHCAYCGKKIEMRDMQVDHIYPRNKGGTDDIDNLMPACRSCNFRKAAYTIEQFRQEISEQCDRLIKNNFQAKMSLAYGLLVRANVKEIKFYFEENYDNRTVEQSE